LKRTIQPSGCSAPKKIMKVFNNKKKSYVSSPKKIKVLPYKDFYKDNVEDSLMSLLQRSEEKKMKQLKNAKTIKMVKQETLNYTSFRMKGKGTCSAQKYSNSLGNLKQFQNKGNGIDYEKLV